MNVLDVLKSPWAIEPEMLTEMCSIYAAHKNGESLDIKAIEAATDKSMNNPSRRYGVQDGVATIPIEGILAKKMGIFEQICGGMSYTSLQQDLSRALTDPDVQSILFIIDSPGGTVDGVQAAGDAIYAARGQKPMAAYVDGKATSAAYWLGSAAPKMYIGADTDTVGSIGVIAQHVDTSNYEHQRGIKITDLAAGQYKAVGSQHAPLSAQDRNTIQDRLNQLYGTFVDTVARNRGTDASTVLSQMADGRVFTGQKAIEAGLVDGKLTLPQLMAQMKSPISAPMGGAQPQPSTQKKGTKAMAESDFNLTKAEHEAALATARKEGVEAGLLQGKTEGATQERQRIQDVEKALLPGHEKLIDSLKFDGVTTGAQAALKVVEAEKVLRGDELAKMRASAPAPVVQSEGAPAADAAASKPAEEAKETPEAIAAKAQDLVSEAKKQGKVLSYAQAVKQATAK